MGGDLNQSCRANQALVLEWGDLDRLIPLMRLLKTADKERVRNQESGITMIETLMAGAILVIGSISMLTLIVSAIATNNRNKIDSTQTMLATSILEQINSTLIGTGTSNLTDCQGTTFTINTAPGGAAASGASIDFTQTSPPAGYYMNYVVSAPCTTAGVVQGTYDVRWRVDLVAGTGATSTYLLTVAARLKNHGEGNKFFSAPVTLRVLSANP
jgi:type II secretory pathway pseudopilin PulG